MPSAHATAGILLNELSSETVEAILGVAGPDVRTPAGHRRDPAPGRSFRRAAGRAVSDAVSGREAGFGMWISGAPMAPGFDPAFMSATAGAVRGVLDAVRPWSTGGVQINFCGSVNTAGEAARAWPAEIADRLREIRLRHDPDNLFPYVPGSSRPAPTN